MDLKLQDKVALVTGAGGQTGYGRNIALTLAGEVAQYGVIVNGIAPGLGDTGLTAGSPPGFKEANIQRSMLKRLCRPEDVGPAVAFLASDVCSYMTGQFIQLSTF